ncbi:glycosyltransferase family 9 protein [Ekhidna sp.]|jgi:ADP-heptose:LPS heptosyltransferase|uniref:glycosyltransferase family 9 protein n=1 Tax=Ekhidna sp. TaxID=2608089 RepID=UPI0032EB1628
MKVLIIHSGTIGETLLTTPIIRILKTERDAQIHLLLPQERMSILNENPYCDKTFDLDAGILFLRNRTKSEEYDWIIDLKNDLKSFLISRANSQNRLAFKNKRFKRWLYTKTRINLLPKKHLVDQYIDLLQPLSIKGDNLGLDFYIPEKDEVENNWLPKTHQHGYAAVAINAQHATRKLPVNRLIELCDRINKPIVLIGGDKEKGTATEIETFFEQGTPEEEEAIEGLNKKAIIFNACGKFNFNQQASLIKNASWVFTYDNDHMHIAAAFKKQLFSIWGNTTPHFGMYPYRTQFTVFENNKLNCRPCAFGGYSNCPKGHFKCMNDVTFDFYLPD